MTLAQSKTLLQSLVFILIGLFSIQVNAQTNADDIIGVWESAKKDAKMEIYKNGDQYDAKLLWGKDIVNEDGSSKKDIENEDEALRELDLVGSVFMKELTFEGDEWDNGKVYNNANGDWYKCFIWMEDEQLHLKGYLGLRIFGQTTKWNRLK